MKLIQYILDNPNNKNIDIASFIHGSLEEKIPGLKLTLDGGITPEQANKLKIIKKHYDTLTLCKEHPQDIIWDLARPFSAQLDIIGTPLDSKSFFLLSQ